MTIGTAEERLLDLALGEVFAGQPAAAPRRPRLLAAILFLCGIGVVAALWWQARSTGLPVPAQDPGPPSLPKPVTANSAAELAALPVDTVHLEVRLAAPAEFAGLRRFRDLRRLRLLSPAVFPGMASGDAWQKYREERAAAAARFADATQFASLGELHSLEALDLPDGMPWTPEHLAFLRNLKLVDFAIASIDLRPRAMVDALVAAPSFRTLRLSNARVGADLFSALRSLGLDRLDLLACKGFDDEAWAAVARLRTLRSLEVTHVRGGTASIGDETVELAPFADAAFDAFAALPELRHLGLDECEFPGDLLARLPVTLVSLDLGHRPCTWGDVRSLRRLKALRALTFGAGLDEAAAAEVLPSWSLERLDYRGHPYGVALLDVVAAQPQLVDLALRVGPRTDLAPLAHAASLRSLRLLANGWTPGAPGIPAAQLAPLVACKTLRTLHLLAPKVDEGAVRELFGDGVAIEIVTNL